MKKKLLISVLAIMVVAVISINGSLAFMTKETEKRVNNFSFADTDTTLNAKLTEPDWDGIIDYVYDDNGYITNVIYAYVDDDEDPNTPSKPVYGYTDGDRSKPVFNPEAPSGRGEKPIMDSYDPTYQPKYGIDLAKNMIPGKVAPKNPKITNTGLLTDEWVAAKVTFVYGTGSPKAGQPMSVADLAKVLDAVTIDWNVGDGTTEWERVSGGDNSVSQIFYYHSILAKSPSDEAGVCGDETAPIFTKVSVKSEATAAQLAEIHKIGGFSIYVEGFAVQSEVSVTYDGFKAWGCGIDGNMNTADDNVVFNASPSESSPVSLAEPGIFEKN